MCDFTCTLCISLCSCSFDERYFLFPLILKPRSWIARLSFSFNEHGVEFYREQLKCWNGKRLKREKNIEDSFFCNIKRNSMKGWKYNLYVRTRTINFSFQSHNSVQNMLIQVLYLFLITFVRRRVLKQFD